MTTKKLIDRQHAHPSVLSRAMEALRQGRTVLVFDSQDREGETDMVTAAHLTTWETIMRYRKDAGGLICVTVPPEFYRKVGMPFLTELYERSGCELFTHLSPTDIPYDAKSSFTITINHRKTFTGVTDRDRALTVREFGKLVGESSGMEREELLEEFGRHFRSPGHVHLLNAAEGLLDARQGHTELTTALMLMAGLPGSAVICEMMGDDGNSLPPDRAAEYARKNGMVFLRGEEIVRAWRDASG